LGKSAGSPKADENKSGEVQESTHDEGVVRKKRIGNVLNTDEVEEDSDRSSTTVVYVMNRKMRNWRTVLFGATWAH
jgi:hypothetical protein